MSIIVKPWQKVTNRSSSDCKILFNEYEIECSKYLWQVFTRKVSLQFCTETINRISKFSKQSKDSKIFIYSKEIKSLYEAKLMISDELRKEYFYTYEREI